MQATCWIHQHSHKIHMKIMEACRAWHEKSLQLHP